MGTSEPRSTFASCMKSNTRALFHASQVRSSFSPAPRTIAVSREAVERAVLAFGGLDASSPHDLERMRNGIIAAIMVTPEPV